MKKLTLLLVALCLAMVSATSALAIPELQLYIEGATYDDATQTWITESTGSLRLWAIADVGAKGSLLGVNLSIAYASGLSPSFSLSGSTTGGYNGFSDPSAALDPTFSKTVTDGSAPLWADGSSLPTHGIYGAGTSWTEYSLGDFTLTDSYITDFNGDTDSPAPLGSKLGQINVYDIDFGNVAAGTSLHFDLYGHYMKSNGQPQYTKAPFSHDAEAAGTAVPEPGTLALLGMGIAGLAARFRRKSS